MSWKIRTSACMLNKLRCHAHFLFSTNQITWSRLLIQIHILNDKQCKSRSVSFFRSQQIWIYTVFKDRAYPGSAGPGLKDIFDLWFVQWTVTRMLTFTIKVVFFYLKWQVLWLWILTVLCVCVCVCVCTNDAVFKPGSAEPRYAPLLQMV